MSNLNQLAKSIKIIVILVFAVFVLVVIAWFLFKTDTTEPDYKPKRPVFLENTKPPNTDQYPTIRQIRLTTIEIKLPSSENYDFPETVTYTNFEVVPTNINKLIRDFGLTENITENIMSDESKNIVLSYDKYSNTYTFDYMSDNESGAINQTPNHDLDIAKKTASDFINQILGFESNYIQLESVEYLGKDGAHYDEVDSLEQATVIGYTYVFKSSINDTYYQTLSDNILAANILVDREYHVVRSQFSPVYYKPIREVEMKITPLEEAINDHLGYFDLIYDQDLQPVTLNQINSLDIRDVELNYYIDSSSGNTTPMYRLTGTGTTTDGRITDELVLKVPAVQIE